MIRWIEKEPSWLGVAGWVTLFLIFNVIYSIIVLPLIGFTPPGKPILEIDFIVWSLLIAPVLEEMLFRVLPLAIISEKVRYHGGSGWLLLGSAISSVIFGLMHGGWANVPLQGVAGFTLCLIFLKAGGRHGNYEKAGVAVFVMHSVYNVISATYNII